MDIWTLSEQRLFHKAFTIYGKDFSFVHKMVIYQTFVNLSHKYLGSQHLQFNVFMLSGENKAGVTVY